MELVLHPGHSKCGSTTIQDFIYKNRSKFENRGVIIPDCEFNFPFDESYKEHLTHTPRDYFAKIQNGDLPISDLRDKLERLRNYQGSKLYRRIIISAENLINGISNSITGDIHDLLNQYFDNIRVVYYIRRQDEFLISSWQQWDHKTGITLDEYLSKQIERGIPNYRAIASNLAAIYTKSSLKISPIYENLLKDQSLLHDFCFKAAIMESGLNFDIPNSNVGMSLAICELMSKMPEVYTDIHDQSIKNTIANLSSSSKKLINVKYDSLSSKIKLTMLSAYNENNTLLVENYMPEISVENSRLIFSMLEDEKEDEIKVLKDEVEKLKDICAVQFDLILNLNKKIEDIKFEK